MRGFLLVSALAVLVVSCGAAEPPKPVASAPPAKTATPATTASSSVQAAPAPSTSVAPSASVPSPGAVVGFSAASAPVVAMPTAVACAFESKGLPTYLSLRTRDGDAFASLVSGAVRLAIATSGEGVAEIVRGGFELHAVVVPHGPSAASGTAILRPARPMVLAGIFSVDSAIKLGWTGGTAGFVAPVRVGRELFDPPQRLELRACKDFGLDEVKFDAKKALPKSSGKFAPRERLLADGPVAIATTPTDAPVGNLAKAYTGGYVMEIDARAGRSLISLALPDGILFGWVPSDALSVSKLAFGTGTGPGVGLTPKIVLGPRLEATCTHDVPIVADLSRVDARKGAPFTVVGRVRAGTSFTYVNGDVLGSLLGTEPIPGVRSTVGWLSVPIADVQDCKRTPV